MYQKIDLPEHLYLFHPGALVVQYPVSGEAKEVIDLSNADSFALFELRMMKGSEMYLKQADAKNEKIITKRIKELLSENNWWIRASE